MSPSSGDEWLIRRASRRLALQAAALVAGAMLLLVVLVTLVVVRGQQQATDNLLLTTVQTADDVGDPPASSWVLFATDEGVSATPGFPSDLVADLAALRRDPTIAPALASVVDADGEPYRVVTQQRTSAVVQVVLDLRSQYEERDRLLATMAGAAGLSLLLAAALGAILGGRAVQPLAHALSLQRAFVADASHELRTPLTLLSTRMQVLNRSLRVGVQDPQVLADSRGVMGDIDRLGDVVTDLLLAADPRLDDQHGPVDVVPLLRSVAASAAPHAAQTGVTLTATVGDCDVRLMARGSPPALRRAVLALVDNAVDHTPEGGCVQIRAYERGAQVVIAVSDTGAGVPPAAVEGLMRRFHSGGHRAGRAHYGLGLALAHDVANRHGGQLRLASSASGTTFELLLPSLR